MAELEDVIISTSESIVLDDMPFLHIRKMGPTLAQLLIKRAVDILISLCGLIVLSPVMLIAAIAILVSDGCPVFFKQKRATLNGRVFNILKFRTMSIAASKQTEHHSVTADDDRITPVGRLLRKTRIDELPQLWNVLKGEMSIVGPRPAIPREVEQYDEYAGQRLLVTPGLTCYWQIQPNRNSLSFDEWVELDVKYIRERSFLTDWMSIFMTFGAVLGMNGI
jgi:lipopolysaccharide/colanic/teichoic acid biosynthesis glycosyltransferase